MTVTELLDGSSLRSSRRRIGDGTENLDRDFLSHRKRPPPPTDDHQLLLAHILRVERAWIVAHDDATVHPSRVARFRRLAARLARGESLAYLTGERWFFGRAFRVTPDVLIPRPETELLVALALNAFRMERLTPDAGRLVDLGTGSGCIAVTLAAELPNARAVAIDTSPTALRVAQQNARRHRVADRIAFLRGDLLEPLLHGSVSQRAHSEFTIPHSSFLIVANLPYLTTAEWRALPHSIRAYEPRLALDGGHDGLSPFRTLFAQLSELAARNCRLVALLEIDPRRKPALTRLARTMRLSFTADWHHDLAGRWRVLELSNTEGDYVPFSMGRSPVPSHRTPAPRSRFPPT